MRQLSRVAGAIRKLPLRHIESGGAASAARRIEAAFNYETGKKGSSGMGGEASKGRGLTSFPNIGRTRVPRYRRSLVVVALVWTIVESNSMENVSL